MSEKIVVLNSGGFDSVVLVHHLVHTLEKGNEIHSLHFKYGSRNELAQLIRVNKVCKKLGLVNHKITLPKFNWTHSRFYKPKFNDPESQYLEYRNLIFLSYALSFAESIGAKKIYLAVLKSYQGYTDTSPDFLSKIYELGKLNGIEIIAPFSDYDKYALRSFIKEYKIENDEYFSCDIPKFGLFKCDGCMDCESISELEGKYDLDNATKLFLNNGCNPSCEDFQNELYNTVPFEMRVLLNNDCQLNCKHCFYGFKDTVSPILPKETIYECIEEGIELGIQNFHFSGKEPFYDDTIFWYTSKLQKEHPEVTYDAVTNGINVPKYINQIKETGMSKIFLSVDEILNTNGVRQVHGVADKALRALNEYEVPVEVFIDLHENNYNHIGEIIKYLHDKYGVTDFYVRTIRCLGNASNFKLLTSQQIESVHNQLKIICSKDYNIVFSISKEYLPLLKNVCEIYSSVINSQTTFFGTNYHAYIELYCSRYIDQITLTPDGYLLGCASEVASPNYDKVSVGNIQDYYLETLIDMGKDTLLRHSQKMVCNKCSFLC